MNAKGTMFTLVTFLVVEFVIMVPWSLFTVANADTSSNTTVYLSLVHNDLGFYNVRTLETIPRQIIYDNRTLNISLGDTVIWENDADKSTLTIVSDQNLWSDKVGRIKVGQRINYEFDNPGTYTFYIKEVSSRFQTIIVNNIGGIPVVTQTPMVNITTYPTSVSTTTYEISNVAPCTVVPIQTSTIVPIVSNYTPVPIPTDTTPDIEMRVRMTPKSVAGIIIVALSIYVIFRKRN